MLNKHTQSKTTPVLILFPPPPFFCDSHLVQMQENQLPFKSEKVKPFNCITMVLVLSLLNLFRKQHHVILINHSGKPHSSIWLYFCTKEAKELRKRKNAKRMQKSKTWKSGRETSLTTPCEKTTPCHIETSL